METTTKITRAEIVERILFFLKLITVSEDASHMAMGYVTELYQCGLITYQGVVALRDLVERAKSPQYLGRTLPKAKEERANLVRKALK